MRVLHVVPHLIYVTLRCKSTSSPISEVEEHWLSVRVMRYCTQHHDASTTPRVPLDDISVIKHLTSTSPRPHTPISKVNANTGLANE